MGFYIGFEGWVCLDINLSQEEKVKLFISLCPKMGLSMEEVLSLYLILGDRLFFLFDLLQGKSVKFPSMRSFHHGISSVGSIVVRKLSKYHYLVNGVDSYSNDIKGGDTVRLDGGEVVALGSPQEVFGEMYLMCKGKE